MSRGQTACGVLCGVSAQPRPPWYDLRLAQERGVPLRADYVRTLASLFGYSEGVCYSPTLEIAYDRDGLHSSETLPKTDQQLRDQQININALLIVPLRISRLDFPPPRLILGSLFQGLVHSLPLLLQQLTAQLASLILCSFCSCLDTESDTHVLQCAGRHGGARMTERARSYLSGLSGFAPRISHIRTGRAPLRIDHRAAAAQGPRWSTDDAPVAGHRCGCPLRWSGVESPAGAGEVVLPGLFAAERTHHVYCVARRMNVR